MKLRNGKIRIQVNKEEKTEGGVFLAEEKKSDVGKVLQVADDIEWIKKGDTILFKDWAAEHYQAEGEDYTILDQKYVAAVL